MKLPFKRLPLYALVSFLGLNSCAFLPQKVNIAPAIEIQQSTIGKGKEITVVVRDERDDLTLGYRQSGFGRGSKITSSQDVREIVEDKIIQGLSAKGFAPVLTKSAGVQLLEVEIRKIEYIGSSGFFTFGIHTKATFNAITQTPHEKFEKVYRTEKENRWFITPPASTNAKYINETIAEAIQKICEDEALLSALGT